MLVFDPDVQRFLELARSAGRPPFEAMSPADARIAYAASWDVLQAPAGDVASVRDVTVSGKGGDLTLRIYRGVNTNAAELLPCMVFLHGGGWVIGNLESHDRLCRRIANGARICVVAVDYRLAPEHQFPAALDDSVMALQWVADNAGKLNINPQRIALGGDSAGGNLAAVLALMGRDGNAPRTMYQALIYPALDLTAQSESYRRVSSGVPLTAATMHYFIDHYAPHAADRLDWRASPLKAPSLEGAPPALVLTVRHDPLCDEGRAYAERLDAAGVRVTALHLNDHIHGMLSQGKLVRMSNVVSDYVCAVIGEALHHGEPVT